MSASMAVAGKEQRCIHNATAMSCGLRGIVSRIVLFSGKISRGVAGKCGARPPSIWTQDSEAQYALSETGR